LFLAEFVEKMQKMYHPSTFGKRPPTEYGMKRLEKAGFKREDFKDGVKMTIREMFTVLAEYVDRSDPDTDEPNLFHMLQTAERAREVGESEEAVLSCLIHDMGKAMFIWCDDEKKNGQDGTGNGEQWALGGDTFVVGAALPDCCVYPELNALNPDMKDSRYNTLNGRYEPGCGMMSLSFAYGHDEYIYQWCKANDVKFSEETLAFLRLHSCYPWHRGGAYRHFMNGESDEKLLQAVLRLNKFDLYSKSDKKPDVEALWPYYQGLIDKFCPGSLAW
jgi:inositol oxygenase